MPDRAIDGFTQLKFLVPAERLAGQQQEWYYAALFIAETYKLNSKRTNLTKAKTAVEEGWKSFALSLWPERVDDKMMDVCAPIPVDDHRGQERADYRGVSVADPTRPEVVGRSLAAVLHIHSSS